MPSVEDYRAAGLLDGCGDDPADRLALLGWLEGFGFTIAEMQAAASDNVLGGLAGDQRLLPGQRHTRAEAIDRCGLDPAMFDAFSRALSFEPVWGSPPGEVGYTDAEIELFEVLAMVAQAFSPDEALATVRVIGSAMARIAESSVSLFLADIETAHLDADDGELALARAVYDGVGLLDGFAARLDPLLRRMTMQAIERSRRSVLVDDQRLHYRYAVGFVDLVGFTSLSGALDAAELAAFIGRFEARAHDVVAHSGARLVKLIGDEVMFVATDASAVCRAGQALLAAFAGDDARVVPRGGIAYGDVLVRGGDYYGTVVNLAARLVDSAVPMEVLATAEAAAAADGFAFEPAGRRTVRGFDEPVTVLSLATA